MLLRAASDWILAPSSHTTFATRLLADQELGATVLRASRHHCALVMCGVVILTLSVATQEIAGPLVIAKQGSFFVGGRDIHSDTLSSLPAREPTGTITVEQMYVRYQIPVDLRVAQSL
jgi:hypothetical protein